MTPPEPQAGFSVLEALVAVLLTSAIAIMLAGSVRTHSYAWVQSDAIARDLESRRAVGRFLRNILHTAYPIEEKVSGKWITGFSGTSTQMTFVGFLPPVAQQDGMGIIDLHSRVEDGNVVLEIGWEGAKEHHSRILARGLKNVEFAYYGSGSPSDHSNWKNGWNGYERLPDLVKITIRRKGPDQVLLLSPKIEVSVRCQYDPVMYGCRFD